MKKLQCVSFLVVVLALFTACTTLSVRPTYSLTAQRIADTIVSDYGITSIQYAIIDNGQRILSGSSGVFSKEDGRKIGTNDIYGIGSTSKMFATAAAMVLRDRGLLDLDQPITTYIPEFTMADSRYVEITPRMLLNHSSGLYGSTFANTFLFNDVDTVSYNMLLEKLAMQGLKAAPGQMSEYCNDGFTLIELLVERISGISYTEFLNETFLLPLGLNNTLTPGSDFDKKARMARIYLPGFDCALPHDTVNVLATGGLYSTAEDLCFFAEVLMGAKPAILSEESALMMRQEEYRRGIWPDKQGDDLFAYGLGWDSIYSYPFGAYGIQALTKGGDTLMYHSSLLVLPDHRIAMAVISSGGASAINYALAASVVQELLLEKGYVEQIITPVISDVSESDLSAQVAIPNECKEFEGVYANNTSTVLVKTDNNSVMIIPSDGNTEETYIHTGDGVFQSANKDTSMNFVYKEDGQVYVQKTKYIMIPGVGGIVLTELAYQKIEAIPLSNAVLDAWNRRTGLKYYVVSEKSSSQLYVSGDSITQPLNTDFSHGYAYAGIRIVNEHFAVNTLKFRDATDMIFETRDGVEYLYAGDLLYARDDSFPELRASMNSFVIGSNGYSQYFLVGAEVENKTLIANIPTGGAIAVYDSEDNCIYFSTVCSAVPPVLPLTGKVVFIGNPGDVFGVAYE